MTETKAVTVDLSDGRTVALREPAASEFLRMTAAEMVLAKVTTGDDTNDGDESVIRRTIAMLSDGALTNDDVLALSKADYSRLFIGLIQVLGAANASPLVKPSKTAKRSSSSSIAVAATATSPNGQVS